MHDDVTLPESQHERQQGHQLLGADGRQDVVDGEPVDAAAPLEPVDDRLPESGGADGLRVGVRVGGVRERLPDQVGRRVDGRADRQVDDAGTITERHSRPGPLGVGRHEIPGVVRELLQGHVSGPGEEALR